MIFAVLADPTQKADFGAVLRDDGYVVRFFANVAKALPRAEHEAPDLIIIDESLAIADGRSVLEIYQERFPKRGTPFLLLSDSPAAEAVTSRSAPGANRRIAKSASCETIRATLASMLGYSPQKTRDDAEPPSDSQRGRLSGINAGGRTFHVQTEAQGRDAAQISTVVVVEGQVRFKKTIETAPDSTAEDIARRIEEQHEEVEREIRSKLKGLRTSKTSPAMDKPSEWDLLKKTSARVKANDFDGALAVLDEAKRHYPDDPRWEINIRLVGRKRDEQERIG